MEGCAFGWIFGAERRPCVPLFPLYLPWQHIRGLRWQMFGIVRGGGGGGGGPPSYKTFQLGNGGSEIPSSSPR